MYKAIGEAAYNDGLFSQAAPFQAFQSSVSQFGDGGLGATVSLVPGQQARGRYMNAPRHSGSRRPAGPPPRTGGGGASQTAAWRSGVSGLGNAYHDGSLGGRTFLPAFSPRAMQGLGYTFRDGVLGDAVTVSLPGVTTTPAPAKWQPDLASIGIGVIAGGLLFYFSKH